MALHQSSDVFYNDRIQIVDPNGCIRTDDLDWWGKLIPTNDTRQVNMPCFSFGTKPNEAYLD